MISIKNSKCSLRSVFLLKYLIVVLVLFILLISFSNSIIAEDRLSAEKSLAEPPRYRVFNLKHISAEQAKKYLNTANVSVEAQILRDSMLSVTGRRAELIKASEMIKLVDAESKFIVKLFSIPPGFNNVPTNEKIAAQLGNILIGSFAEPPGGIGPKAIINPQGQKLLVIAPVDKFSRIEKIITEAVRPAQKSQTDANLPADTNEPAKLEQKTYADANEIEKIDANDLAKTDVNDSSLGDVFDMLVTSLGKPRLPEPQKTADLQAQTIVSAEVTEPNKPAIEREEQIVQRLEEPQQPEKPAAAVEQDLPDQNEPQPLDTERMAEIRSYQPEPVIDGNEQLTIEVPEKLKIVELLGLAGEYLNINYMYDPAQLQGEVTLKLRGKTRGQIQVKELYPLVESVLKYKGLVMVRTENDLVIIAPKDQAKNIDPALIDATKGKVRIGDVIVTRIFELKYIDAESAKNLLAGMSLGVDINTSASKAGVIIVTGYAHRMARIEGMLNLVDIPGEAREFRFRQLKYTMAVTLKDKIKALADQLGTVSVTVAATAAAPPSASARRRGEAEAAYRARIAREARARRPTPTPTPAAEPTVYLDVDDRTNRILMIGLKEQLDIVEHLIDTLDVEQQDMRSLRLYEIRNVDAGEVTGKLQELGIISTAPTAGRARTTRTTQRVTAPGTPPGGRITAQVAGAAPEQEPLIEEPQVVIIESTNSLLVNATAEQHAQIAMIIGFVDSEPEEAAINYVVYPLENQDPEDLAGILNQLIQETIEQRDPSGKLVRTETTRKTEEDITIIADPKTYSLIVYASKKNQQWISSLIKQLDEYRAQVLLDVTLVEISKNDEFNFDLNLIQSFPDLVSTSGLTGVISGVGADAMTSSDIMGKLSTSHRRRFIDLQSEGGAGTAFYGDRHINVLLTAMQTKGYGRVLARPKLLVNDNEQGTIKSQETTYITRTRVSYRRSTVEGTIEDIPVIDTMFEPYEAGIQLDIEPHISKGDQLRLIITMTRTDFRDTPASLREKDPTPPDKVTSDVTTVVTVPDAHTIILGGLERLSQSKGGTKVPILGDIPIVGGLFRSTANIDEQSRLYVFVKAHILRPGEETGLTDIEIVSAKNRAKFEKYEKEMQEYEDWPGIKPEPLDPIKILEDD